MSRFHTTLWSRLHAAAEGGATAFDELSLRYRAPLIGFLRGRGVPEDRAEDVVQEVFLRLLGRDLLRRADAERGRFRSYLLGITLNLASELRRREQAEKRGGGLERVPLEATADPAAEADFAALWLQELVRRSLEVVHAAYPGQHQLLALAAEGLGPGEIAERTGRSAGAVRVALHKARKRLAEALRAEVARYCSSEEEFAEEMRTFEPFLGTPG
ncbi:MAG: RNA polymerase sigma factor [Planctomycetes bacterium]|nr:RNA polymerase sigma factor [Planctomycetota bacterium]